MQKCANHRIASLHTITLFLLTTKTVCIISLPYLGRRDLTPVHISLHTRFECCNVRNSHVRCRWVVSTVVEADDHDRQNSQSLRHLDDVSQLLCLIAHIWEMEIRQKKPEAARSEVQCYANKLLTTAPNALTKSEIKCNGNGTWALASQTGHLMWIYLRCDTYLHAIKIWKLFAYVSFWKSIFSIWIWHSSPCCSDWLQFDRLRRVLFWFMNNKFHDRDKRANEPVQDIFMFETQVSNRTSAKCKMHPILT